MENIYWKQTNNYFEKSDILSYITVDQLHDEIHWLSINKSVWIWNHTHRGTRDVWNESSYTIVVNAARFLYKYD